ncbi:MAG: YebC/PmpR family DNA-binding transcriptional regulator [Hydrogenophilus sp.]|nr:YebC/PmpR family DNA-binding transcriptional regulator [Hydrogenophilus sp.]
MAGHSKWANIRFRKERQDAKRGQIFTRLIREITVAARQGGGNPDFNPRLRVALEKAKEHNMPAENIERAIKRGTGELEGVQYEEVRYEGYGPGGAAILVDCMTDNRTRTVAEIRHTFTKHGGNLGTDGCVAFQFKHCGEIVIAPGPSEEQVIEAALEAGADDILAADDGSFEIITAPNDLEKVKRALIGRGITPVAAEVIWKALNEVVLTGEEAGKMRKLLDALENLDDVQAVFTSAVLPEES